MGGGIVDIAFVISLRYCMLFVVIILLFFTLATAIYHVCLCVLLLILFL